MSTRGRNILSMLDNAVRWTGIPARVAHQLSNAPEVDRRHRPLRWIPILLIALSCALFVFTLMWPSAMLTSFSAFIVAMTSSIHANGPLGKSALEDDEREAALRKDSFLFCLWVLAAFNCISQLLLMALALMQNWQVAHGVFVAASVFMLNLTLFGCLPTLYASWKLERVPSE